MIKTWLKNIEINKDISFEKLLAINEMAFEMLTCHPKQTKDVFNETSVRYLKEMTQKHSFLEWTENSSWRLYTSIKHQNTHSSKTVREIFFTKT